MWPVRARQRRSIRARRSVRRRPTSTENIPITAPRRENFESTPCRWGALRQISSAFMTFTATLWNGSRTVKKNHTIMPHPTALLGPQEIVRAVFSAAVLGTTITGCSIPRTTSAAGPSNGMTSSAAMVPGSCRASGGLLFQPFLDFPLVYLFVADLRPLAAREKGLELGSINPH